MVKTLFFFTTLAVLAFTVALTHLISKTKENHQTRVVAVTLVVFAPSSFIDPFGPGIELKSRFEKKCDCTVEFIDVGGANTTIERLQLNPQKRVDVVLGLDLLLLSKAAQKVKFQELNKPIIPWAEEIKPLLFARFMPYDWSPMGFVYRKNELKIDSKKTLNWDDAIKQLPSKSLSLQDPILSAPGKVFLYWMFAQAPDFLSRIKSVSTHVFNYSPSWSTSYGLFKKHQTKVVFTYLTSLIYHWQVENDKNYDFMLAAEGQPIQVEYAAVPNSCWNCDVAKQFVQFLTTPESQTLLAQKNYMLPIRSDIKLDPIFNELPKVKIMDLIKLDEFTARENELINGWKLNK